MIRPSVFSMTHVSPEESLERYKNEMGEELGSIFYHLLREAFYITSIWEQYELLFETPERINLLNDSCGYFFSSVQRSFFDYTLLGVCRLTDPPKMGKYDNLTVQCLPPMVRDSIRSQVESCVKTAVSKSDFCRDWRNKKIAHNDLARKMVGTPLASATRKSVTDALIAIHNVLRIPALEYCRSDLIFVPINVDDIMHLLYNLYYGQRYEEERTERAKQGIWDGPDRVPEWLHIDWSEQLKKYE